MATSRTGIYRLACPKWGESYASTADIPGISHHLPATGVGWAFAAVITQRPPSPVSAFLFSALIFSLLTLVALATIWPWLVRWSRLSRPAAALSFGTMAAGGVSLAVFWHITNGMRFDASLNPQVDYSTPPLVACLGIWLIATVLAFLVLTWGSTRK